MKKKNPRGKTRRKPHDPSTPDQERLRAVGNEIRAILQREKLTGMLALCSMDSAEWLIESAEWRGLYFEGNEIRFRVTSKSQDQADATAGSIANMRDLAVEFAGVFGQMFDLLKVELRKQGWAVDHVPFAAPDRGHGEGLWRSSRLRGSGRPPPSVNSRVTT